MESNVSNILSERYKNALENWNVDVLVNLIENNDISSRIINSKNSRDCSALFVACEKGNLELVRLLIDNGANVNDVCVYGNTPLHVASEKANPQIVKYLIEHGAVLDTTNDRNESALHKACQMNMPKNVKLLLDNGANPDIPNSVGRTVLFSTCYSGYYKIAELLVKANADVNVRDLYNESALQIACKYNYTDIAKLLLENGANPDIDMGYDNIVQWAIKREDYDLVDLLIKRGADLPLEWIVRENKTHSLQLIVKNGCKVPLVQKNVDLLAQAIYNNNVTIAALLMKNVSMDVNDKVEKLNELLSLNRSDSLLDSATDDAKIKIRHLKRERERQEIVDILCAKKNKSSQRTL